MFSKSPNPATRPATGRVALFGGSFDPPHLGHLEIARAAMEAADLDCVLFLPCATSPHKTATPPAPAEDRLRMLSALVHGHESWAQISDIDLKLPYPSFTWRTLNAVRPTLPEGTQLYWILGADQWNQLERWAEPDKLRQTLHFLVFPREGDQLAPRDGWNATFLEAHHPASSSAIRHSISSGNPRWHSMVSPEIRALIEEHALYHP
ncbi:nicotinate (nicotinamide) nucleotide adenylyltransferase [Sulfuriroseicoccus oceanibius]|uniref:Probable nicotinate-nucleotide adenylyltransferase n=1 Tax=Sulfuriroseicoccus oceanibius TaxID=2707525 RepID=A0A6B3L8H8_9BACT|nr:nicotinate (nicotinamide) nucleotide adenylyltransferase [Sulfuriroseicoccus oceanibius]QQL43744.1 nicotinate (nicotinamide) nucleotide adenylyltransferase [Sulfuriroseicoccus oceanibius]